MSRKPYILFVAPFAPPQNVAEAIQVGRILMELDQKATGRLITIPASNSGWARSDDSLALDLANFDTVELTLPFHALNSRLRMSRHRARYHVPDAYSWIIHTAPNIARGLEQKPDIIYSRSHPISAAILGRDLKRQLNVPWVMHLSDPWTGNPYRAEQPTDAALERSCFAEADHITLTTEGQANYYRAKYPEYATKIAVAPNVMPEAEQPYRVTSDPQLRLVFVGNFYGERSPAPLVAAIEKLRATHPEHYKKLRVDIYGNAQPDSLAIMQGAPETIHYRGPVSFTEAQAAQVAADVVLSIEPTFDHPLAPAFLPSKVLDCIALGKPLLAITPAGSETAQLCAEGYGWAIDPTNTDALATQLKELIDQLADLRTRTPKAPPARYTAATVVDDLIAQTARLIPKRRVLMQGYYGRGNFGDDVLMKTTHGILAQAYPHARINVLVDGADGNYIRPMLGDVEVLQPGYHGHFRLIVHGGGGVFFDFESASGYNRMVENLIETFGLWRGYLIFERLARRFRQKPRTTTNYRLGFGIGIGGYAPGSPRLRTQLPILADFDALWVRDSDSRGHLARVVSVVRTQWIQGSDLAFLSDYWLKHLPAKTPSARPRLGVILRDWAEEKGGINPEKVKAVLASLATDYDITAFIFDAAADPETTRILAPYNPHIWHPETTTIEQFSLTIATQDVLLTSRAHGAICGACLGVPSVVVNIEPKLQHVTAMLSNSSILVEPNATETWPEALQKARAIAPATIAADVARNRTISEAALKTIKRWFA